MRIIAFSNNTGAAWWRLESVAKHITMKTDHEFMVFSNTQWNGDIVDSDIVVFQMTIDPQVIREAQAQGAKVVYELDDLLTEKIGRDEINDKTSYITRMIESIKLADMVTTTTKALANKVKEFNKNVVVLPNYIDTDWWTKKLDTKRIGDIRIGWAGSTSHKADLEFLAPIMKRITDEYDNTKFIYCGAGGTSSNSEHTQLMYGKDIFKDIPTHRREFYLGTDTDLWGYKSKTLHLDIALAPLVDDEFNKCKSNIKWQEYSLNGWAGVYSNVETYRNIKYGLMADDAEEFYNQIKFLIENPKKREKLAEKAEKEVSRKWTLDRHFKKWIQAYKKCLSQ